MGGKELFQRRRECLVHISRAAFDVNSSDLHGVDSVAFSIYDSKHITRCIHRSNVIKIRQPDEDPPPPSIGEGNIRMPIIMVTPGEFSLSCSFSFSHDFSVVDVFSVDPLTMEKDVSCCSVMAGASASLEKSASNVGAKEGAGTEANRVQQENRPSRGKRLLAGLQGCPIPRSSLRSLIILLEAVNPKNPKKRRAVGHYEISLLELSLRQVSKIYFARRDNGAGGITGTSNGGGGASDILPLSGDASSSKGAYEDDVASSFAEVECLIFTCDQLRKEAIAASSSTAAAQQSVSLFDVPRSKSEELIF